MSPVSDAYGKKGLASAKHRTGMCKIAVDTPYSHIELDNWEAAKDEYSTTRVVLDHFKDEINSILGGSYETADGKRKPVQIALLAGADLVDSMNTPGVWSEEDLHYILGNYPLFILERKGTDLSQTIAQLERFMGNFYIIPQLIQNDVSSTKIRLFRKQGMSIWYLVPDNVVAYIEEHELYKGWGRKPATAGVAGDEVMTCKDNWMNRALIQGVGLS